MNDVQKKNMEQCQTKKENNGRKFRWAAEFMSDPGGFPEKAEVVSNWFSSLDEAKARAQKDCEKEVSEYPFSRGMILKLIVEDNAGTIIELSNAKNVRERYS